MTYTPATLKLAEDFIVIAALSGINLSLRDIDIHESNTHIKPTSLDKGMQAVYVFMQGSKCLKVGKAGPNGTARFCHHHYGLKAPSTLAKSLIKHQSRIGAEGIDEGNVSAWIISNTHRINFLIPATLGIHVLSLLEAFIQCRLQPEFEGFDSQRLRIQSL